MTKEKLINRVLAQMQRDIDAQDWTAIEGLLAHTPEQHLQGFLSEFEQEREDTPRSTYMSARESAIDEQAAEYDDMFDEQGDEK